VLAALVARATSGAGQRVEIPMFDAALAFNLVEHLSRATIPGGPPGYNRVLSPHRGPHRTSDGWVAMLPYTDAHWRALFEAVGEERQLERPEFADHRSRLTHADEVYGALAAIIARRPTAAWVALGTELGIPVSVVPPLAEIVDDEANHRGVLREAEHPVIGTYRSINPPVVFSASGQREATPAPLIAEHTDQILAELGFTSDEIDRLVETGAVRRRRARPT
jgi:crotonobetainyl-CoA:carnitine CoA-transferase CaiB-like acyl-CoA transferase